MSPARRRNPPILLRTMNTRRFFLLLVTFLWPLLSGSLGVEPTELRAAGGGRIWVYLPPDSAKAASLPCVLVPPAGSRLFHGMTLGSGDRAEHLPYVAAGFAVVSFDISGPWAEEGTSAELTKAVSSFVKARCGVTDALAALDTALSRYPQIDPKRVAVAGHSSAATLALQIASSSTQFQACVAYAPTLDVEGRLGPKVFGVIDQLTPGGAAVVRQYSPVNRVADIHCPVFLFHAEDDASVSAESLATFRDALQRRGQSVTLVTVPSGGHYQSMIEQGIPQGIAWLQKLPPLNRPAK
jgi:dipeptidyl aminopeptidase/acylaminoacyl peptidase